MTKRKIINILSITTVLGLTAFIIVRRIKNKKLITTINGELEGKIADSSNAGQKVIDAAAQAALPDGTYPIQIGAKNKKVLAIQQLLNSKFQSGIDIDGVYGDSTYQSLCNNLWSVGITHTKATSCYDFHLGAPTRRAITQADYTALSNK